MKTKTKLIDKILMLLLGLLVIYMSCRTIYGIGYNEAKRICIEESYDYEDAYWQGYDDAIEEIEA